MKLNKKKKGFTLIELMAVIAIVAILAAVLVPTVNGYITRAKKTGVITQARSVVNAVEVYNQTGTQITNSESVGSLIAKLDVLDAKDVNKLGVIGEGETEANIETTYYVIKQINGDPDAANKIQVNSEGKLIGFTGLTNLKATTGGVVNP